MVILVIQLNINISFLHILSTKSRDHIIQIDKLYLWNDRPLKLNQFQSEMAEKFLKMF